MHLLNPCSVYLLIGALVGMFNYLMTRRTFRRAGRAGELPGGLLAQSVFHHALVWPETAFWVVLLLLTCLFFERKHE